MNDFDVKVGVCKTTLGSISHHLDNSKLEHV